MQKASFNLSKFISTTRKDSFARTNRFEVLIIPPKALGQMDQTDGSFVSLYCEQASIPSLTINSKAFKIFGPSYQRPMTSDYGGEGLAFTFHVDRDMFVRRFFEDWMHMIVNPIDFTVGYQQNYVTSIYIRQLDEQDRVTHEIELLEAFPRNMNIMDLNNSSMNQTHRLNILFAYRYWKNVEMVTPVDVPRAIVSPETYFPEPRLATTKNTIAAQARKDFAATDPRRVDI
jgi:hypothetical protein